MAELIGVVSGVIGIVSPAVTQVEQLVDRCQDFRAAPAEFRDLKSDCEAVRDSLHSLETNLTTLQRNATIAPEHIQRFKSDAESVKSNFETAQERCLSVEKYFPTPQPDSSSCGDCLLHLRQALLRFFFAGTIAREFEEISKIVRDASADDTALHRFLHISIHIEEVKNEVRQVGVGVTAVNKKADTLLQRFEEGATEANDHFEPKYYVPDLSQKIILDFSTCDAEGVPITMEGKLKRALLGINRHSEFSRVAVAVGAGGMGGVGKTNALLGLGWEEDVRKVYENGGIFSRMVGTLV